MKKILIINAHTKDSSFCNSLSQRYAEGAKKAGHEIKVINLKDLPLEQFIKFEHTSRPDFPPELLDAQKQITWADHLVFTYPTWWATPPALLKVFIEIIFQSGFAYKYQKTTSRIPKWDKLLTGKSSRLIATMDAPPSYYKLLLGDPGFKMMKANLDFCGVKPVKKNYFGSVKMSNEKQKKSWLEKAYTIGLHE